MQTFFLSFQASCRMEQFTSSQVIAEAASNSQMKAELFGMKAKEREQKKERSIEGQTESEGKEEQEREGEGESRGNGEGEVEK